MRFPARKRSQRGVTLLVMTVILGMGVLAYLLTALNSAARNEPTAIRNRNAEVLAQAKAALIGYVAKEVLDFNEDTPGRLPCPESSSAPGTTNEGTAASGSCTPVAAIQKTVGRLPWRTLGIDKLVDAESEPLWYAVSPNWVTGGLTTINGGTAGQLTVDGTTDIVAIIIAPGRPLSTSPTATQIAAGCTARNQARNDRAHVTGSTNNLNYLEYLECQNGSPAIDTTFGTSVVDNATNLVINDQAVVITAKELLSAMQGPLAERMQRTVAPLLSEFSDTWIAGNKFMPYAVTFSPPEAGLLQASLCGGGAVPEGLLPLAPNSGGCSSQWNAPTISGDGIESLGCSAASASAPVVCSFRYYRFTALGNLLLGLGGVANVTATMQASAPHAAASFRTPITQGDISITAGTATLGGFSLVPKTSGDADLSFTATVTTPGLCTESALLGLGLGPLLCSAINALSGLGLVTNQTVTLQYPQLGVPSLNGTRLTNAAKNGSAGPFNLLSPGATDPHYWFVQNRWYQYTYYALAPSASAAQTAGSHLLVNDFPTANGATNDKRFVLAVMGPPATPSQTLLRGPTAAVDQYLEGANAITTTSPRAFAWQVFASSGNDRIATCPFTDGVTPCN